MKAPFKHFDLPTHHLTGDKHYVPPKARQSAEIERRRTLPRGTVLAEQQLQGVRIASTILNCLVEKQDLQYAAGVLTAGGLNSAWYGFAKGSDVMRRRLHLPYLAGSIDTPPATEKVQLATVRQSFTEASSIAEQLKNAIELRSRRTEVHKKALGRVLGNASLSLACVTFGRSYSSQSDPYSVQMEVRQQSLIALEAARTLEGQIGTPPSLAQLADQDSDFSVYIRRTAPNAVFNAFEAAVAIEQAS